jgi:hypothetical protein
MKETRRREFFKIAGVAAIGGCLMEATVRAQEKTSSATNVKDFAPGEKVPTNGIYEVIHDKLDGEDHAQQHRVILIAGALFPACKVCREWVRFRLYAAAERVEAVPHFTLVIPGKQS